MVQLCLELKDDNIKEGILKPGNFESQIHFEGYRDQFYKKELNIDNWLCNHGKDNESLNGRWHYTVDQYDTCLRAKWFEQSKINSEGNRVPLDYDFNRWAQINVPLSWNVAEPELFFYEGPIVYTREFCFKKRSKERIFLNFHGIQYEGFIFMNKHYIGCHKGGSTGFCVEITDEILNGDNRILVVADNTRRSHQLPALNTDWFNYGGIYRDIEIIRVPKSYIKNASINLIPDGTFSKAQVDIEVGGSILETSSNYALIEIPELGICETFEVLNNRGSVKLSITPELWSPDNPKLYDCSFKYGKDIVKEKIGFREITTKGNKILLNGKEIFLKGISCHEDSVSGGKYISPLEVEEEMLTAKELGCNYLRLAHYPHSELAAKTADRLGLMLWEEIPVYWAIDFANPITIADAQNQLKELIRRDINRASVIIWSVGNENADTDERLSFMRSLALLAKKEDNSRLVSAACLVDYEQNRIHDRLAENLDIIGLNEYFGWYDPDFSKLPDLLENSKPDKPVVISETGAGAKARQRGGIDEHFTEDMQKNVYEQQVLMLKKTTYIRGMSPWILFDFRCPRRTNFFQKGFNLKGLIAEDRKYKKPAFYVLQNFYNSL